MAYDVIIQAGQSNSEGCGLGPVTEPFVPSEDIFYLNSDMTINMAREAVWDGETVGNFALAFCARYVKSGRLLPGRKLLVVRAAVGGTGFLDNRWKLKDDLFLNMMAMTEKALSLNPDNKLVALLWHQGETDASYNASREVHFNHLSTLIRTVRNTFSCENLPFIAGDFVQHWKMDNLAICEPVIAAIKDVCDQIGYARFIETDGLLSNDQRLHNNDTIHFCREALNQLGEKYYNAFCEI